MENANLLSVSALTDLDDALARFGSRAKECMETVQASLRSQMAELAARREEAQRQIRVCEINCAEASDEELEYFERQLEEAKDRLYLVKRWQTKAEESCQSYFAAARHFERIATDHIPKAQLKLREKNDQSAEYLEVQLDSDVQSFQRAELPPQPRQTNPSASEISKVDSMQQFSLPPGFRWVSLEHISRRDDLRRDEGFSKVSEHDMRRGFGTLRRQVLPYLQEHPDTNGLTFLGLDGYTTEGAPKPRQKAYDVFFGQEAIVLDGPYPDGTFSVTNGRHRIKVARDLGWSAVPVRFSGQPR